MYVTRFLSTANEVNTLFSSCSDYYRYQLLPINSVQVQIGHPSHVRNKLLGILIFPNVNSFGSFKCCAFLIWLPSLNSSFKTGCSRNRTPSQPFILTYIYQLPSTISLCLWVIIQRVWNKSLWPMQRFEPTRYQILHQSLTPNQVRV